ncbi:hypothetical protein C6Y45_16635 [Alkalicoccus saliphilus]|uniref:Uncharacterized protein n=1 Tax=Alkalicoccus saliphilus TaxID=200989 RepID=A0A2T4U1Y4_9BACI|nr:hypothetical protein C6Y45_16635 [Alkalicoccus saliphilus]
MVEVECGRTIQKIYILDLWKCYICEEVHYLLLLDPKVFLQNETGKPDRVFKKTCDWTGIFYEEEN